MRRIIKQTLDSDGRGRPIAAQTERLTDDDRGLMTVTTNRRAVRCSGCSRPVVDIGDLRGRCDYCQRRGRCVHCAARCQVCSRNLCGNCRRGFAGATSMTVCPICLVRLQRRQALLDRAALEKQALEFQMARQRAIAQARALQMQDAQMRWMARLQAAKFRAECELAAMRERNRLQMALVNRHA